MEQKKGFDRAALEALVAEVFASCEGNRITAQNAIAPEYVGLQLFEAPVLRIGAADDPLFAELKKDGVVGPWHRSPEEWLDGAKTVLALFFPFTERVLESNRVRTETASDEWLHARIEGQAFQNNFAAALRDALLARGIGVCVPGMDPRFFTVDPNETVAGGTAPDGYFGSCWSDRHVSYICGLGTFCLSKGLISPRGVAGRYTTLITDGSFKTDARSYTKIYEHCADCGACAARCPANAIDPVLGKNHKTCKAHLDATRRPPRYGCGLCQTGVPCEHGIPAR